MIFRNRSIFETLIPRGSNTKNTDASLMCAISWPAFATHVYSNYKRTKNRIIRELDGEYGFKRYIGKNGMNLSLVCIGFKNLRFFLIGVLAR